MRVGTTFAVMVLATGVMCGVAAAQRPKAPVSEIAFKQLEPKPEHTLLNGLVGHWTTAVHTFHGQFARARDSKGTADVKALMGGLFFQLTQTETRNKQPFELMTIYGYSEALNRYTADTIDTTTTGTIHYTGTYDAAKKQITMTTHYTEGRLKTLRIARTVTTFVDDKTWTYDEFVSLGVDQPELQVVAIKFTKG